MMNINVDTLLENIKQLCDPVVNHSPSFGVEFGSHSLDHLKRKKVSGVAVSSFINLHLFHFMKENGLNIALSLAPLPIFEKKEKFMEGDFELIKALAQENYWTVRLPSIWVFSKNGSSSYFLQTLGINKVKKEVITIEQNRELLVIDLPNVVWSEFIMSLGHLSTNFLNIESYAYDSVRMVLADKILTKTDIVKIKRENINSMISFKVDSRNFQNYVSQKLNVLFIDYWEYCNIALRKFSQMLQLEAEVKTVYYNQPVQAWSTNAVRDEI